jgi:EAL and modified HD-GYP domain-containing signal transduction protein
METYIVRQPILDQKMHTAAYELVYQQDSSALYNQQDARVADAILTFFNQIGEENSLLEGRDAYITFTPNLLLQNSPSVFDPKHVVVQIEESVLIHPTTKDMLMHLKKQGFRLALVSFDFNRRYLDILPYVDIMKVDLKGSEPEELRTVLSIAAEFHKTTIAYNVNTPEALSLAQELHFDYIQGQSVADMVSTKSCQMEHLRSNLFRLIVAITREEPDFKEITQYVSLDVTLTYSLIKMVNSAYFALPNQVKNVQQALAILGIRQLRQWIYLVSFSTEDGLSNEVIKLSFVRALFCQNICARMPHPPVTPAEGYLLGMFSTLGILLQVPLADAVRELAISGVVKDGLMGKEGRCRDLLEMCIAFEKSKWSIVNENASRLEAEPSEISTVYLSAAEEASRTWSELMKPFSEEN